MNPNHIVVTTAKRCDLERFFYGRFLGSCANKMMLVALSWQMYDLTGSAWDLGIAGLYQFLPAFFLTVPAGYLIDRYDRRHILAGSLLLQAVAAFGLALANVEGWIDRDLILSVCLLIGVARSLQLPSQQALLPQLFAQDRLTRALAQNSAVVKTAVVGGPALGGFIYAYSAQGLYWVCTILLMASYVCIVSIRPLPRSAPDSDLDIRSMFAGFSFIWRHKIVLGASSLDLFATMLGGATALMPIFAKDVLDAGPLGLGLLRAAPAVGGLGVAVILSRLPIDRRVGYVMFSAVAVYGLSMIAFSLSTSLAISLIALAISGAADTVSVVIRQSLIQLETTDQMRGRVSAVNSTVVGASNQLGEFESGVTAEWLGAPKAVLVGAVGTLLVVAVWIHLFPSLAKRHRMQEAD